MPPGAIVFDFDGTIADTEWPEYEAAREAYRSHGLDLAIEDWVKGTGRADNKPLSQRLEHALGARPDPEVMRVAAGRPVEIRDPTPVLPGVVEVIQTAARAGVPLAVASSSPSAWVDRHLDRLDLVHHFESVRTRDHVDRGKPAPDVFLAAAGALAVDPGDVVAIEDSRVGCASAKAAGMTCVVVPNRVTIHDLPMDADVVLDTLLDFPFGRFDLWSGL